MNHPFFQYIEALAASGITGGCGGNNFWPDSPVTRRQDGDLHRQGIGTELERILTGAAA